MASICLPKGFRDKLSNALDRGEITTEQLYKLSPTERHALLSKYVGEANATLVSGKFEQAMVSNRKNAMTEWVNKVTTEGSPLRRDLMKKIERNEKFLAGNEHLGFLDSLVETKMGMRLTEAEAGKILSMKEVIDTTKLSIDRATTDGSESRMVYGYAVEALKQYVATKQLDANAIRGIARIKPENFKKQIINFANTTKALVATLDISFIGRQGIKMLLDGNYKLWSETAVKAFQLFAKELFAESPEGMFGKRSDAAMSAVRAFIYSSENALNGKYNAARNGYGLGVLKEEAFPENKLERIPLLGRVFKGAETSFNGSALFMRKKYADLLIRNAERNGVDMLDPKQATAFGSLVSSMTGRGEIGKLGVIGEEVNALVFSVRFLKSNFDTLTAHLFDSRMTPESRKVAALSTLRIAGSIAGILALSKMIDEDSVDFDPRSSAFGQIQVGNHRYDITGGMRGLVTLGARIMPTYHNGEWGFWTKSASTGKYTKMSQGEFGEQTALDTFEQFVEGKLSPTAGMVRDIMRGRNFQGERPDFVNTTIGLIVPISAQMLVDELQKGNDDILLAMIAEGLGISATDTTMGGFGARWDLLRNKVNATEYQQALKAVTNGFNQRADRLENSVRWDKMDNKERSDALTQIKTEETNKIMNKYGL